MAVFLTKSGTSRLFVILAVASVNWRKSAKIFVEISTFLGRFFGFFKFARQGWFLAFLNFLNFFTKFFKFIFFI